MTIEQQALDLVKENEALKASLYLTVEFCRIFSEESFVVFHDGGTTTFDMMMEAATDLLNESPG